MATAVKAQRAERAQRTTHADPLETAILAASGGDRTLARSYVIARERELVGTAWLVGEHADQTEGVQTWEVPSITHGGTYGVKVNHRHGIVRCPCTAGAYGAPCGHKGAVVFALYQRAASRSAAARDFSEWGFWDGVQGTEAMYG